MTEKKEKEKLEQANQRSGSKINKYTKNAEMFGVSNQCMCAQNLLQLKENFEFKLKLF